jgi:hypothetical protein
MEKCLKNYNFFPFPFFGLPQTQKQRTIGNTYRRLKTTLKNKALTLFFKPNKLKLWENPSQS